MQQHDRAIPQSVSIHGQQPDSSALPLDCTLNSKAASVLYFALRRVVCDRIPVEGWGDADYAYLRFLARGLLDERLFREDFIWTPEKGLPPSREVAAAAKAVRAYMVCTEREALASGDEDEELGVENENYLLRVLLNLQDPRHPFAL